MTDFKLYTLAVPNDPQTAIPSTLRQQLAAAGLLGQDGSAVEQLSSEPGEQTITGYYRGQYAGKMAAELEELSQASGFDELPVTGLETSTSLDGYYAIESAEVDQVQPHTERVQRYDLTLTKEGTRSSHFRAVATNPQDVTNPWADGGSATIGVPAAATKVHWFDRVSGTRDLASAAETRSAELGDVEVYAVSDGVDDVGTETPTLLYEMPYGAEEHVDCRVFSTLGHSSKHDADGSLQWRKRFSTQADVDGAVVLDNGLLRLRLDEAAGTLEAEEWAPVPEVWESVSLSKSNSLELWDVDIRSLGMARDVIRLTFEYFNSLYTVDCTLATGRSEALFTNPTDDSYPTALTAFLDPIAATTPTAPMPSKTLVSRQEVS